MVINISHLIANFVAISVMMAAAAGVVYFFAGWLI